MSKLTDNIDKARAASRERFETARDIASEGTVVAREKMSESKARAAALLGDGREKAAESVAATREAAKKAAARSEETITNSPPPVPRSACWSVPCCRKAKPKANLSAARDARSTKRQKPLIRRRRTPAATRLARWV